MTDPSQAPPPPNPLLPPDPPKSRGLGYFFVISGSVVLAMTLGCVFLVSASSSGEMGGLAIACGSPTFILGAVFLWLGTRRLKR